MNWLSGLFKGMSGSDLGALIGGIGNAYGAYRQSQAMKELLKLQKQDYYDQKARKKRTQARLNLAAQNLDTGRSSYDSASLPLH